MNREERLACGRFPDRREICVQIVYINGGLTEDSLYFAAVNK